MIGEFTIEQGTVQTTVAHNDFTLRTLRGVQRPLLIPEVNESGVPLEPKGIVYTKRWVVELLLDLAGFTVEKNLLEMVAVEPAAGDGAFLVPMVERLVECARRRGRPLTGCSQCLMAYELDSLSAARARELVQDVLTHSGVAPAEAEELSLNWVRTGDYLLDSAAAVVEADFVIGNPPYIRLEDLPIHRAGLYRKAFLTMRGRADLYVAFFEAALRQLNEGGVCAFICADRWMRNQYGAELRRLVTSEFSVEFLIEMHRADAFNQEVDAYPAITVIRRSKQSQVVVATVSSSANEATNESCADTLRHLANGKDAVNTPTLHAAIVDNWFEGDSPWPCQSPEQLSLLRVLERRFAPLEESAKVGIGVATGNDQVFITIDPNLVESSRLLKLALADDITSGSVAWSGHYLVDPWDSEGLVNLANFPRLKGYFESNASTLKRRHTASKDHRRWYRTIDRVTHSLLPQPKLYIADIKNRLEPVLDYGETYPHHNLYFIQSNSWDLEVLGGLLLSAIGLFFIESYGVRMRGGYLRFQAQYLRRIRVPSPLQISGEHQRGLAEAFRARDRQRATEIALAAYGVNAGDMERALGYRY